MPLRFRRLEDILAHVFFFVFLLVDAITLPLEFLPFGTVLLALAVAAYRPVGAVITNFNLHHSNHSGPAYAHTSRWHT